MDNSSKKKEDQARFFDMIQHTLPANHVLVDVVSELLNVGIDASYRRIRGAKLLDFEEIMILCKHFRISMDSITGFIDKQLHCEFAPVNVVDTNSYLPFAIEWSNSLEYFRGSSESEIILSATDIPAFNLLSYNELAFFQLFAWNKAVSDFPDGYDEFVNEQNTIEFSKYYQKISRNYQLIPSTEIWTDNTLDSFLKSISYHFEMIHFKDNKVPLFLCEQLMNLMDTLYDWATKGTKGSNNVPYKLYISEVDIGNTFILLKSKERSSSLIKLFAYNGLSISDESFCQVTDRWLQKLAQRATLISGTSEKERFKFFNAQRQKINFLIDKIQNSF